MIPKESTLHKIRQILAGSEMLLSSKAIGQKAGIIHPYVKASLDILIKRGDIERVESSACVLYKNKNKPR